MYLHRRLILYTVVAEDMITLGDVTAGKLSRVRVN
jgi:hypothetical protein